MSGNPNTIGRRYDKQFMLRVTPDLHRRINSHAIANSRSMNSEIVLTLEAAYPAPVEPEGVNEAMLEALRSINKVASPNPQRTFDDVIRDFDYIMDRARAAISKAEGRTNA